MDIQELIPGFHHMSEADRKRYLDDNADKIEPTSYYRNLNDFEVTERREEYSDKSIVLGDLESELSLAKASFNGKIKPLKEERDELLLQIRTKQEYKKGTLYHFADHEKGFLYTYTESGELHASRRLRPDERQATINQSLRAVS